MKECVCRADATLRQREREASLASGPLSPVHDQIPEARAKVDNTSKLPKLQIQHFSGDTLKWREFWDSFRVSVHDKALLSPVEKFQYLKSFLCGEALHIVQGYSLSADTYETALAALKERYDHPERCIHAHLEAMIYMDAASTDVDDLQKVFDQYETHIRSLVALGLAEDTFGRVFAPLMLSKFPRFIRIELNRRNGITPWTLANARQYLKDEIAARHMGSHGVGENSEKKKSDKKGKPWRQEKDTKGPSTAYGLVSTEKGKSDSKDRKAPRYPCVFCSEEGHYPENCQKFKTASARRSALQSDRCLLCLSLKHRMAQCRSAAACKHCGLKRSHHHSFCKKMYGDDKPVAKASGLNADAKEFEPAGSLLSASTTKGAGMNISRGVSVLGTARAVVSGVSKSERVRIVMDNCSTRSFARTDLLHRIGARDLGTEHLGLAGLESLSRRYDKFGCYEVIIHCLDGDQIPIIVNGLKTITCPVDKHPLNAADYPILSKFELADSVSQLEEDVQLDLLIGLDYYYRIVGSIEVRLDNTLVLLGTKLGYIANGSSPRTSARLSQGKSTTLLAVTQVLPDDQLDRLWRMEDVGISEAIMSVDDAAAAEKFHKAIGFDQDMQRYSVRWPWKVDSPALGVNFGLAYGRLKSLLKRLDPSTLKLYDQTIRDQLANTIVEMAPDTPTGPLVHYIPHHCIVRPENTTTKLRVVYDASAKSCKADLSLNDCLYRGPVILADLCGLLMRFRQHKIGISSDIEKAFLQVALKPVDRDVTRFLWIKNITLPPAMDNLIAYRFTRVLFGVKASPYMLAGTISHHLANLDTVASRKIQRCCYVDNVLTGCLDLAEANKYYTEAKDAFKSAAMNMRQWFSNDKAFMDAIPEQDRGTGSSTSVLGVRWNLHSDTLLCVSKLSPSTQCRTKPEMLRAIAQLFDPCGFLVPVSVVGKIILQKLWMLKICWDTPVLASIQKEWDRFFADLLACPGVAVPRFIGVEPNEEVQLHCFCDASQTAYAAAVYRLSIASKSASCGLLFAKVRVSPIKEQKLTIPRLELTALAMGCRLLNYVSREIDHPKCRLYAWTDSQCSLSWVCGKDRVPVYIKNRVSQIQDAGPITLRYVPTSENPADLPTKGISVKKLHNCALWWRGPQWLIQDEDQWPKMPSLSARPSTEEIEEDAVAALIGSVSLELPFALDKFSALGRLQRTVAWVLRFIDNVRSRKRRGQLLASEISRAMVLLLRYAQRAFAAEDPVGFSQAQKQLCLFVDPSGTLRCSGKLDAAELPYDACFPRFLPRQSPLTRLIVEQRHQSLGHAGLQHVLADLRSCFWIPRGRSVVKGILKSCMVCRRWKGGPYATPKSSPLPVFRASERPSFSAVGIDYVGPLSIRSQLIKESCKVWIVLFTCCSSRAIHLEVVSSMTTVEFLLCFRRFIAYCGSPELVISDNAKQFRLAAKAGEDLWEHVITGDPVKNFSAGKGITWKFIVEFAPWMGGMYERLVGIVKKSLKCMLQGQLVNLVELQTICAEVYARPLTYCEEEITSSPLTPNDLVQRRPNAMGTIAQDHKDIDDPEFLPKVDTRADLILKWKRIDTRIKQFWDVWRREYLVSLRERIWRPNNRGTVPLVPKVGSVVQIGDKDQPRGQWLLGRIVKVFNSPFDQYVRSVKVKTSSGKVFQRPLKLVYPLEIPEEEPNAGDNSVAAPNANSTGVSTPPTPLRPLRQAALAARQRWQDVTENED